MDDVQVPDLDIDKGVYTARGRHMSPASRLERRIVASLIAHLERKGFAVASVYDGEEETKIYTAKDAMELIFNLDEASLRFWDISASPSRPHGVLLVVGNGEDIISDWNYSTGDPDGFNAAMEAFEVPEVR